MFYMKRLVPFREYCVHVFKTKVSVKLTLKGELVFLCQLTCQSADIMSSLCGVGVHICVHVNNFSKTTRPRDILFFF